MKPVAILLPLLVEPLLFAAAVAVVCGPGNIFIRTTRTHCLQYVGNVSALIPLPTQIQHGSSTDCWGFASADGYSNAAVFLHRPFPLRFVGIFPQTVSLW